MIIIALLMDIQKTLDAIVLPSLSCESPKLPLEGRKDMIFTGDHVAFAFKAKPISRKHCYFSRHKRAHGNHRSWWNDNQILTIKLSVVLFGWLCNKNGLGKKCYLLMVQLFNAYQETGSLLLQRGFHSCCLGWHATKQKGSRTLQWVLITDEPFVTICQERFLSCA